MEECIFYNIALHIECRFNKNSLLQCYSLAIFPAGYAYTPLVFIRYSCRAISSSLDKVSMDQFFRRWLCDNVGTDDVHLTLQFKGSNNLYQHPISYQATIYFICPIYRSLKLSSYNKWKKFLPGFIAKSYAMWCINWLSLIHI